MTSESNPVLVARVEAEPVGERPALNVACVRLSDFARAPAAPDLLFDALAKPRTHCSLIEPRLLLELIAQFSQHDSICLAFVRTPRAWRFEIEASRVEGTEHDAAAKLLSMLRVVAPNVTFKPSLTVPTDTSGKFVTRLSPDATRVAGGESATIWLPSPQFAEADLGRALAAAAEFGLERLSFKLRTRVLTDAEQNLLRAARFRLQSQPQSDASAQSQVALLGLWLETSRGCTLQVEVVSAQPPAREALIVLGVALFGRAARTAFGTPALDLRLSIPAGALPWFRFWPTPDDFKRLPDSPQAEFADAPGTVILGRDAADDLIRLDAEARARHLFVLGGTGAGKTTMLFNMILEDITKMQGVMLIDVHGDFADAIRANVPKNRHRDLIWVDAGSDELEWRLDLLATPGINPALERSRIVRQFLCFFRQMYSSIPEAFGPMFDMYFSNALLLLMSAKEDADRVITKFEDVLVDKAFRRELLGECDDEKVVQFWRDIAPHVTGDASLENVAPYIASKLDRFTGSAQTREMIGGAKPRLDLRQAMDQGKIVLVRLSKGIIGDDARFLGALFLMALTEAAMGRARVPESERRPFHVYLDEFANFATQTAADLLGESRKYGLKLNLATQSISQLSGDSFNSAAVGLAALANCGSYAVFRVGLADATLLAQMVEGVSARELTQLGVGEMIARRLANGVPRAAERLRGLSPTHWGTRQKRDT